MSAAIEVSQRDLAAAAPLAPATKTARHACIVQILSRERIRSQAQPRKAPALRGRRGDDSRQEAISPE